MTPDQDVTDDLNMYILLSGRDMPFDFQRVLSSSGRPG